MNGFGRWIGRDYSERERLLALLPQAVFVVVLLPALEVFAGVTLDRTLGLTDLGFGGLGDVLGGVLMGLGLTIALWAVLAEFVVGRGTPAVLPPRRLVVRGPYRHCRNPMALGTILYYLGVAVWLESVAAVGLVAVFAAGLLAYAKTVEERRLVARFGDAYRAYRDRTPFIVPRLRRP